MIEYRVKEFCSFYEIERNSVVRGVEYWLPVDIYGVYGNPKQFG